VGESNLAGVLGGLGLFLLGGRLAGAGLGSALGGWIRERVPQWTRSGKGSFQSGLCLTVLLGWSPSLGASAPALARRWGLPAERCAAFLAGSTLALGLLPLLAWLESLGTAARALACLAIGGGLCLALARPRLAALGEGLAGHGLVVLGLALLAEGFASLPAWARLTEVRAGLVTTPLALLAGAALGIAIGAPAAVAVAVQAAAAGAAGTHVAAALLAGAGASAPWLGARVGRLGDADDGAAAAVHGALAAAFALCAGLALAWAARFPAILDVSAGRAQLALSAFLLAGLAAASLATLAFARQLEALVRDRLIATRPATRLPFTLEPERQSVPLLAVESLDASVDAAIGEVREIARARLGGSVLSDARAELARDVVSQVRLGAEAFASGLAAVRWPGAEVAAALAAERSAAACGRLLEKLLAHPPAAGDEALRTELALAAARAANLIEFSTRSDELPLVEDLRAYRDALEAELADLATRAGWADPGLLERLASLRALARDAIELAEARAAGSGGEAFPASPAAGEPRTSPAADLEAPRAPLPGRRQRIKSATP
jgi:phosphate:Na+ symporter